MTAKPNADEQEIIKLEHLSHDSFLQADIETLTQIISDDFIFTDPEGNFLTKDEWINDLKSGAVKYEYINVDDLKVRIYNNAAVTLGRVSMKGQTKEGSFNSKFCYTAMYIKMNGKWQVVAEQANLLPQ